LSGPLIASYAVLWALVLVLSVAVFALYHHFGKMYLGSREGRQSQGPEQGKRLAHVAARTIRGDSIELPLADEAAVVLFADTTCKLCDSLRPDMRRFAEASDDVRLLVVCGGDSEEAIAKWAAEIREEVPVVLDVRQKLTTRYAVGITPFMVAVGDDGVVQAKGLVNDYDGFVFYAQMALEAREDSLV
jgi:AhpC/TSA family